MESEAPPRRRPYDSLSLPAVEGQSGEYAHPFDPRASEASAPAGGYAAAVAAGAPAYAPPGAAPSVPRQDGGAHPSPAPARPAGARLGWSWTGRTSTLRCARGSNLVGRGWDCDLQLMDQGVSRRHVDVSSTASTPWPTTSDQRTGPRSTATM
jgi:hypothetical protein